MNRERQTWRSRKRRMNSGGCRGGEGGRREGERKRRRGDTRGRVDETQTQRPGNRQRNEQDQGVKV